MNSKRALALAVGAVLVVMAAAFLAGGRTTQDQPPVVAPEQRPRLLLLTSLPIVFPERLTLDAPASPVLQALQQHYQVEPISVTAAGSLQGARLLLMVQPQAQPAEQLVELDQWVREGGRVLLLADPALAWPSERPLGDPLRPPPVFADTGLLGHWGLRLDAPDQLGPAELNVDGRRIRTTSPGTLTRTKPACATDEQQLVARCKVGKGKAVVIADADFLNVDDIEGVDREANLKLLISELQRLKR